MSRSSAAALAVEDRDDPEAADHRDIRRNVPPDVRLWGFIRRGRPAKGETIQLLESDVSLWLDRERCRFLVVAEKAVKDDLAPVEFVQFIRELRHSTTQILYKFEIRYDGTAGRPVCVWP